MGIELMRRMGIPSGMEKEGISCPSMNRIYNLDGFFGMKMLNELTAIG